MKHLVWCEKLQRNKILWRGLMARAPTANWRTGFDSQRCRVFYYRHSLRVPYGEEASMVMQWIVNPPPERYDWFDPSILHHSIMQRWQSGPMHGTANPESRWFKSSPLLQYYEVRVVNKYKEN